jgi:N-acetylglucosaminyl-diphospho-decaprenol L-rhamnosyltransferase
MISAGSDSGEDVPGSSRPHPVDLPEIPTHRSEPNPERLAPTGAQSLDLSVIIVNWNVRELLRACLTSLRDSPGCVWVGSLDAPPSADDQGPEAPVMAEVIVVDNASTDGSAEMVVADFPWVHLVASDTNRGFSGGNNQGLTLVRGQHVFFLNPDTEVVGDALRTMMAYMTAHPEIGALGPELRYGDGQLQPSRRRFPTFGTALFESTPLAWRWPQNRWARRYHMADQPLPGPDEPAQSVDWLVGAAIMTSRDVLDQVGGFDEGYFMYSEELDWCRRVAKAGWPIAFLPSARVIHYEGKSSEQVVTARHIRFQSSKIRYFRKFHGLLAAESLRVFLLAAFAVEWGLEAVKWLLGSRRRLRRERLTAYGRLLRTGLRAEKGRRLADQ